MKAVCQRCGADKPGPLVPCRSCDHVPTGEERTIAWLLSDHHLSPSDLEAAAGRIRAGERLAPPEKLLAKARQGLQEAVPGRRRRPRAASAEDAAADTIPAEADAAAAEPSASPPPEVASGDKPRAASATWISAPSLRALLELDAVGPPGGTLPPWALGAFAMSCVLLTPLPTWMACWIWRGVAPQASRQLRTVALFSTLVMLALWAGVMAWAWNQRLA